MKPIYKPGVDDNLNVDFDPDASRLARVFVSYGRIEIVLCDPDHEWVDQSLATLAEEYPSIVVACPNGGTS